MKGWMIFKHSVLMVLRNWKVALQIGLVPMALAVLLAALIGWPNLTGAQPQSVNGGGSDGLFARGFVIWAIFGVFALWTVVNWHRFVLKEEYPQGWIPPFHAKRMASYFLWSLMLGLILLIPTILVGTLVVYSGSRLFVIWIGLVFLFILAYRISSVLPAAAVGEPLGVGEAWEATKGNLDPLFRLSIFVMVLNVALNLPSIMLPTGFPILRIVLDVIASLISGLIGVSVLTTLYGHYIEGRSLD